MRVAVAMSGGVDSSVAAYLLKTQGYEVVGISLRLLKEEDPEGVKYGRCCSPEDLYLARKTAELLGIPHYILDRTELFEEEIIAPFVAGYRQGITPNPCVICNERVKFSTLFHLAQRLECELVATGHYARVVKDEKGKAHLLRGKDRHKDQSYFLFPLKEEELSRLLLPLGMLSKEEVRALAREAGLPNADKPDSQDLCFLAGTDLKSFLASHGLHDTPGKVVGEDGVVYGEHSGIHHFTVGQRRGLAIAGGIPLYVRSLDPETQRVIVAPRERLLTREFWVDHLRWIHGELNRPVEVEVEVRYRTQPRRALLHPQGTSCRVELLHEPAIPTPGQAAVFYQGEEVLGGGWVRASQREEGE